ncbi:MAG TPA: hypothetical protein VEA69_17370 [Tepidisphaeraceae bacterium]|nr:hypothetical protein [Tepidisphaeraceae bacterium]
MRANGQRFGGRSRGTTWADVIAVVALLAMIGTLVGHGGGKAREKANQVKCQSNLRQICTSIIMYANDNKGAFPRARYTPDAPLASYTGEAGTDPLGLAGSGTPPTVNDVTAALFLLMRVQELTPELFICPSSSYDKDDFGGGTNTSMTRANFKSARNTLSYGLASPYPTATAVAAGYKWNHTLGADFAIMGDLNSGAAVLKTLTLTSPAADMQKANTRNHDGQGQSVGFGDGHVEWAQTPFVGMNKDNIYTVSSGRVDGGTSAVIEGNPSWAGDTVLLPVMVVDSSAGGAAGGTGSTVLIVGGVVLLLAIGGVILFVALRKKPAVAGAGAYVPRAYAQAAPQRSDDGAPRGPGPPPLPPL